jgi:predicted DNA-binding ribbon-helix-helix protein
MESRESGRLQMQSVVKKRSVMVGGRKTSISLENEFWDALNLIVRTCNTSISILLGSIATKRPQNLSSAVRVFILDYYRKNSREFTSD